MDGRTDRRTDGQTEFSSLDRVCIARSAVKTIDHFLFENSDKRSRSMALFLSQNINDTVVCLLFTQPRVVDDDNSRQPEIVSR